MGREIKRVPADFDWPLNKIWEGFLMPEELHSSECTTCEGTGYSPEGTKLHNQWYSFDDADWEWVVPGKQRYNKKALQYNLTQEDVQALVDAGRLWDFIRVPRTPKQIKEHEKYRANGGGYWMQEDNGYVPTAEEVNEWARKSTMGHDSLNEWIVIKNRCKRTGVSDSCSTCHGHGCIYPSKEIEEAAEAWEHTEPPEGIGFQLWETVSEGSPISPAFATAEELINHLVTNGDAWDHSWTRAQAEGMLEKEWAPSGMLQGNKFYNAQESAEL